MMKPKKTNNKKIWKKILADGELKSPVLLVKIDVEDYQIVVTHGLN